MPRFRVVLKKPYGVIGVEAENIEELLSSIERLTDASSLLDKKILAPGVVPQEHQIQREDVAKRRRGRSEATLALDAIERHLLKTDFFSTPKTTSEVRQKILELAGLKLQSRKVSQALGILFKSKKIIRVGSRGSYRWFIK
ncbi:MAG: hypothetical protein QXW50_00865 [Nitrososphaerota archaeon]